MQSSPLPQENQQTPNTNQTVCFVCGYPSAVFYKLESGETVRLGKTMIRVSDKKIKPAVYVHQNPCLPELIRQQTELKSSALKEPKSA